MKIAIIGTGYVGLPTGVGLAELGNEVVCIDLDERKINALKQGQITLYEEGLEELLLKNIKENRLKFTTSMKEGVENAELIIIAVGTPPHPITKEADMKFIHGATNELAAHLKNYAVIATKSTVPVGTGDDIEFLIKNINPNAEFDVISLPEFLREGFAVYDFFNPDRIVVGSNSQRASDLIAKLYEPFKDKTQILYVKRKSAEAIKYASNSFLAVKIHYINEFADFCEKTGVNVLEVAHGMGLDKRIGDRFLNPGPGYGGSCFPKDTQAMALMGKNNGANLTLINAAIKGNEERKKKMAERILHAVKEIAHPKIAVLGLAFKDGTDDCRESPAIEIIEELLKHKVQIHAFDPKAMNLAKELLKDNITYAKDAYECAKDADVLAVLTEWSDFKKLDLERLAKEMKHKKIIDCRNLLDEQKALSLGFEYKGIGI